MTGNGSADRSRRFARALRRPATRYMLTRPDTPKTAGKAERFIQTLLRAWSLGLSHPTSDARNADLPRRLDRFDRSRPRPARNGISPLLRANNLVSTRITPH
jgi:hypothetical protein